MNTATVILLLLSTHQHKGKKREDQLYITDLGLMKLPSGVFCVKEQAKNTRLSQIKSTMAKELPSSLIGVQSHYGLWVQDVK